MDCGISSESNISQNSWPLGIDKSTVDLFPRVTDFRNRFQSNYIFMYSNVNCHRHMFGYISDMLNKHCVDYLAISETMRVFLNHSSWQKAIPFTNKISLTLAVDYRPTARYFWIGFDGVFAFTIMMGMFVLLRVKEFVIVLLWKYFCASILFCHQIRSCFHTWTHSLAVI